MDGLEPIHEAQERDRKDLLQPRLVPLKPNPDHHRTNDSSAIELTAGRSVRKRARARSRSAQIVENPPRSRSAVGSSVRRSAALCGGFLRALNKIPKRRPEIFHAIGRKGVVQGQSRQALMSWRVISHIKAPVDAACRAAKIAWLTETKRADLAGAEISDDNLNNMYKQARKWYSMVKLGRMGCRAVPCAGCCSEGGVQAAITTPQAISRLQLHVFIRNPLRGANVA